MADRLTHIFPVANDDDDNESVSSSSGSGSDSSSTTSSGSSTSGSDTSDDEGGSVALDNLVEAIAPLAPNDEEDVGDDDDEDDEEEDDDESMGSLVDFIADDDTVAVAHDVTEDSAAVDARHIIHGRRARRAPQRYQDPAFLALMLADVPKSEVAAALALGENDEYEDDTDMNGSEPEDTEDEPLEGLTDEDEDDDSDDSDDSEDSDESEDSVDEDAQLGFPPA